MSVAGRRILRAVTRNFAVTAKHDADRRLRGRTYAIPFEQVWQAARSLAGGGLRGWRITDSDDYEGIIRAEARTPIFRFVDDVIIRIVLDNNAQTRVDLESVSRKGGVDFGTNARRIGRFCRMLDRKLAQPARTIPAG